MATLPKARTRVVATTGAVAGGVDTICILAPCATAADVTPRLFGTAQAIFDKHGYSEGVEYAALHAQLTGKNFIFVALPIVTAGVIGRENKSGNTGSCVTTVTAGGSGVLAEHSGGIRVKTGGTIGTSQIVLEFTFDGQRTCTPFRLGTGNSYTDPYFGFSVAFGAGTLVAGDLIHTWEGTAPRSDAAGWAAARAALAQGQRDFRNAILCGELQNSTEANAFLGEWNAYETANKRFKFARAAIPDRLPLATMSKLAWTMAPGTTLTFAEVGGTGDTITRSTGSWITDGAAVGDTIVITGTAGNNITAVIASLTATVITLGAEDLAAEVTAVASVKGYPTLTFAEVGGTGDTITRNRGSWLADGFRVGDKIAVTGTVSNNITATQGLTAVTALVLTLNSDDLAAEVIRTQSVTITAGQTKAEWMAASDAAFAAVNGARLSLSAGRGRITSAFHPAKPYMRRPAGWFASFRHFAHDLHIAPWRKEDGQVPADLLDTNGMLVEWDDCVDGEAGCAARFTTLRSYENDTGAFIALDLTRAADGSLLCYTQNAAVVNLACQIVQRSTENAAIGKELILNDDGTATAESLSQLEMRVNADLEAALLTSRGEGPRASLAVWSANKDTIFNVPEPVLLGVTDLNLNGYVHSVDNAVRLRSNGQG